MAATPVVFIPAQLCDEALYQGVISHLGTTIEAHVMTSPLPVLADSVADILARAPATFALVGTSYGGNLALEIALTAPGRVTALWLMGCDPAAPATGGPDLAGSLKSTPDAVIGMLAGLVVHKDATAARETFVAMAHRVGGTVGAAQATALGTRPEATSRFDKLTMPVLAVWGDSDPLVAPSIGRDMARAMPHAHFHVLPNCGHLPTLEYPAETAALFTEFVQGEAGHHH